jgi:hypothetical protein
MEPDPNPYSSPQEHNGPLLRDGSHGSPLVAIVSGIAVVVACPIFFAAIGGVVAVALNKFAPGYYPGVFSHPERGGYAANLGVGIGILQGLGLGLLVGMVVTASLGWFGQLRPTFCVRVLTTIAAFGIGCAVVGALAGYGLGTFVPGYYRSVFSGGQEPNFNPVDVGIGLGCSEGLMLGAVVGTVAAVVLAWRKSRAISPNLPQPQSGSAAWWWRPRKGGKLTGSSDR